MKVILLLLVVSFSSSAQINEIELPYHRKISSKKRLKLRKTQSIIKFTFPNIKKDTFTILYSIDGVASSSHLKKNGIITLKTNPGTHKFQFYYTKQFTEVFINISVIERHEDLWGIEFKESSKKPYQVQPLKPIIYLYPEKEKEILVNVRPVGEFILTYPEIKGGWRVTAQPNGELEVDGEKYSYLFWESSQYQEPEIAENLKGFIVEGKNIVPFLKDKLSHAGLNSKEQADFITFWAPRILSLDKIFIQFQFNEECDRYASLEILPKPDNLYRLFMSWRKVDEDLVVEEQKIQVANRVGFTVIEWGGAEFKPFLSGRLTKLTHK
ncbi:MAG: hypothetical protein COA33_012315 [Fluviicola sp.]|nr:hypothetical protein [Fluviicola sp.]